MRVLTEFIGAMVLLGVVYMGIMRIIKLLDKKDDEKHVPTESDSNPKQ